MLFYEKYKGKGGRRWFQQYPPEAQNIFKEFPTNNAVTENGKELYFPKGGRGFEGEPGVPPRWFNVLSE